ncbi:hypothetical protein CEXT_672441 [Caerostris extrusa]|uniref:Uncharacterized protein n=1 Tax=Caerostris extrusa TaxID=172846 RepID=A0AAV4Y5P7_CAEEX|nr:hypothetical protein CEXT_672441 [Caerostris extrusa]
MKFPLPYPKEDQRLQSGLIAPDMEISAEKVPTLNYQKSEFKGNNFLEKFVITIVKVFDPRCLDDYEKAIEEARIPFENLTVEERVLSRTHIPNTKSKTSNKSLKSQVSTPTQQNLVVVQVKLQTTYRLLLKIILKLKIHKKTHTIAFRQPKKEEHKDNGFVKSKRTQKRPFFADYSKLLFDHSRIGNEHVNVNLILMFQYDDEKISNYHSLLDPGPTELADPGPTELADPAPTELADPAPTELADPAPTELADPGPTELADPAPTELADPGPTELADPGPTELADPGPTELADPDLRNWLIPDLRNWLIPDLRNWLIPTYGTG